MPFKSQAQAAYLFATKPAMAREWASKTANIKSLPVRIGIKAAARKARPMNTGTMGGRGPGK